MTLRKLREDCNWFRLQDREFIMGRGRQSSKESSWHQHTTFPKFSWKRKKSRKFRFSPHHTLRSANVHSFRDGIASLVLSTVINWDFQVVHTCLNFVSNLQFWHLFCFSIDQLDFCWGWETSTTTTTTRTTVQVFVRRCRAVNPLS